MSEPSERREIRLAEEAPFALGALSVSPATRQVEGFGVAQTLEPRVMQVLVALGREPRRVIGRDELIERCWHGVIVGDNAINRVISRLRALAEATGQAFAIETISKVGYRLTLAEAAIPVARGGPYLPSLGAGRPGVGTSIWSRRNLLVGATMAAAGLAGGITLLRRRDDPARERYEQAVTLLQSGNYSMTEQATANLRELTRTFPASSLVAGGLALALATKLQEGPDGALAGRLVAVRDAIGQARAIDPGNVDALVAETVARPVFGRWREARADDERTRQRVGQHWANDLRRASLEASEGRWAESQRRFAELMDGPLVSADTETGLAVAQWNLGKMASAEDRFAAALRRWPSSVQVRAACIGFFAFTGRIGDARVMAEATDNTLTPLLPVPLDLLRQALHALDTGSAVDRHSTVAAMQERRARAEISIIPLVFWFAQLGAIDAAFAGLEQHYFRRLRGIGPPSPLRERNTTILFAQPTAPLRHDPRFPLLLRRIGLPAPRRG